MKSRAKFIMYSKKHVLCIHKCIVKTKPITQILIPNIYLLLYVLVHNSGPIVLTILVHKMLFQVIFLYQCYIIFSIWVHMWNVLWCGTLLLTLYLFFKFSHFLETCWEDTFPSSSNSLISALCCKWRNNVWGGHKHYNAAPPHWSASCVWGGQ